MPDRRLIIAGFWGALFLILGGCYGVDLEDERFSCFGDQDCDPAYQCRLVEDRRICMADDSDDVRLCEEYCTQFANACGLKAENPDLSKYESEQECLDECDSFPTDGNTGDTSGHTVQCRMYHLGVAAQNPDLHCPHAWPFAASGGCTGDCFDFCQQYRTVCGQYSEEAASPDEDLANCRSSCREFQGNEPEQLDDEPTGNTLECRQFYLDRAAQENDDPDSQAFEDACDNARSSADDTGARCR